jgi:hypothetical protein
MGSERNGLAPGRVLGREPSSNNSWTSLRKTRISPRRESWRGNPLRVSLFQRSGGIACGRCLPASLIHELPSRQMESFLMLPPSDLNRPDDARAKARGYIKRLSKIGPDASPLIRLIVCGVYFGTGTQFSRSFLPPLKDLKRMNVSPRRRL